MHHYRLFTRSYKSRRKCFSTFNASTMGMLNTLALPHADDLIGDAVAQQTNRKVARFKGEGAVLGNRQCAALGVADNRRTRFHHGRTSAS